MIMFTRFFSFSFVATVAILTATILLAGSTARRIPERLAMPLDRISLQISDWSAVGDHELPAPSVRALDATAYLSRTYRKSAETLDLFIAFYAQQRAGAGGIVERQLEDAAVVLRRAR